MVRHDDPCQQAVVPAITAAKGLLNGIGCRRPSKPAFAATAIQPGFNFPAVCGRRVFGKERLPFAPAFHGEGIRELEGEKLSDVRGVEMRQVTPLMPSAKSSFQIFRRGLPVSLPFCADQFEQAGVPWRIAAIWIETLHDVRRLPGRGDGLKGEVRGWDFFYAFWKAMLEAT